MQSIHFLPNAVALALLTVLLLGPTEGLACSRRFDPAKGETQEEQNFNSATYIFRGLLTSSAIASRQPPPDDSFPDGLFLSNNYKLTERIKGNPPPIGRMTSTNVFGVGCSPPMLAGEEYVFFVEPWGSDVPSRLKRGSLGMVAVFGTKLLLGDKAEKRAEVERVRALAPR